MGASQSRSNVDQQNISNIISEVIIQQALNCAVYVQADQSLNVSGTDNEISNVEMVQGVEIVASCFSSSNSVNEMNSKIKEQIEGLVQQKAGLKIFQLDQNISSQTSKIISNIQNVLTSKNLLDCATSINTSQSINVAGKRNIVKDIALKQTMETVRNCVMDQIMNTQMINDIDALNKSTNVQKSGFSLFDIEITPEMIVLFIIVIVVFAFVAYIYLTRNSRGSGSSSGPVIVNVPAPTQYIQPQYAQPQYAQSQYAQMPQQYSEFIPPNEYEATRFQLKQYVE